MNMDGALPFMLWARPTKTGERVWLWTRAGSSPQELEQVLGYIAPACFARGAQVHRKRTFSTLVAVDVIRRDPLERATAMESPLGKLSALVPTSSAATNGDGEPITAASITPVAVPAQRQSSDGAAAQPLAPQNGSGHGTNGTARRGNGNGSKSRASAAGQDESSVIVGGEDLSDYID